MPDEKQRPDDDSRLEKPDIEQRGDAAGAEVDIEQLKAEIRGTEDGIQEAAEFGLQALSQDGWTTPLLTEVEPSSSLDHAFQPSINATSNTKIDIAEGAWTRNGVRVTGSQTALEKATEGAGSTYIYATINSAFAPTTLTIAASATAPDPGDRQTKRLLVQVEYDADGKITSIERKQLGDIMDGENPDGTSAGEVMLWDTTDSAWKVNHLVTIEDSINESYSVVTDIRYDSATHKLQMKKRTVVIVNGVMNAGAEGVWTDITTAAECPTT